MLYRVLRSLAVLIVCAVVVPAAAQADSDADFDAGLAAYDAGDYAAAAAAWEEAARGGDLAAMRNLGHLYRWGRGVPRDPASAALWYERAARRGLARAQVNLAAMYLRGEGVGKSRATAVMWLKKAAAQGNAAARTMLADLTRAEGAPADRTAAARQEATDARERTESASLSSTPPDRPAPDKSSGPGQPQAGVMVHLGAFDTRAAAERAWADLGARVPALAAVEPYYMPGYLPERGNIVRLYATGPRGRLIPLCAKVVAAVPGHTCELHRFWR